MCVSCDGQDQVGIIISWKPTSMIQLYSLTVNDGLVSPQRWRPSASRGSFLICFKHKAVFFPRPRGGDKLIWIGRCLSDGYCFISVSVTLLPGLVYLLLLSWSPQFIPFVLRLPGDWNWGEWCLCLFVFLTAEHLGDLRLSSRFPWKDIWIVKSEQTFSLSIILSCSHYNK